MGYWLDIKLKIMRFFRKHKKKIIIILIIWAIVIAINYYLKNRPKIVVPKTTYDPHSPVMDNTDDVPEKYKEPISNLVHNYIEYCNNKDYESAYNLLSKEFKEKYCDNIEDFKEYVDNIFSTKKIYNIQNFSNINNTYVYRVRLLEDILESGTTDDYKYSEEKYVIKEEDGILKMSLNGYCGKEDMDVDVEDDNMQIKILKKDIQYDKTTYTVEIKNKTSNYIVIADTLTNDEIQIKLPNEQRTAKYLTNADICILPNSTETFEFTFDEYFDDNQEPTNLIFNTIKILPEYTGREENIQKEIENAVKLYSLSIDLIPTIRK